MTRSRPTRESSILDGEPAHLSTLDLLAFLIGAEEAAAVMARFPTLTALDDAAPQELTAVVEPQAVTVLLAVRELGRRRASLGPLFSTEARGSPLWKPTTIAWRACQRPMRSGQVQSSTAVV
jgi:hypothetical protein